MLLLFPWNCEMPFKNSHVENKFLQMSYKLQNCFPPSPPFLHLVWFCVSLLSTISNSTLCLGLNLKVLPSLEPLPLVYVMELFVDIKTAIPFGGFMYDLLIRSEFGAYGSLCQCILSTVRFFSERR